jgi:hypothetical protein
VPEAFEEESYRMGTNRPWLRFTLENAEAAPESQGIYEICNLSPQGKSLWRLGKVPNLRKRLVTRLTEPPPPENCYFRYFEAGVSRDIDELAGKLFDSYNQSANEAWEDQ